MMKATILSILKSLGLYAPMRKFQQQYLAPLGLAKPDPLIPEEAFSVAVKHALFKLLEHESPENLGEYLEFGVSRGTSMATVYHVLEGMNLKSSRLIGFDSFEGLPPESKEEGWKPGSYRSSISATRKYLKSRGVKEERIALVKRWFKDALNPETTTKLTLKKASLIMIDGDIYSASKTALEYVMPLIEDHAVIIFDDWGWTTGPDQIRQREAFK